MSTYVQKMIIKIIEKLKENMINPFRKILGLIQWLYIVRGKFEKHNLLFSPLFLIVQNDKKKKTL